MVRFKRSVCVVLTITFGALLLSGCSAVPGSPGASLPAQQLSTGMKAAQDASQAVGEINARTGTAVDVTE